MLNTLHTLCSLNGVSGDESAVRGFVCDQIARSPYVDNLIRDNLGNVLVHLKGEKKPDKTVMIAAHMDEVGLIVTGYTSDGFLRFSHVGGINKSVLLGRTVVLKNTYGVIGTKAVHMCSGDEKASVPSGDLLIDIGVQSREEAERIVRIGETAVFDTPFSTMGDLVKGRAIDDRAGCAVLLELAKNKPPVDLWLAFTVQEEVGLRGAKTAAFQINPDLAIVVDATTAADTVGVAKDKQVCCVNGGAVVSFMDGRTLYDKPFYDHIMAVAEACSIPAQPKSMVAGGNDAGAIQTAANGAKVSAISLPCRYIHSPSCVLSMKDMDAVYALIWALLGRLEF